MLNSCDKSSETSPVLRMYLMKFAQTKDCRNIVVTRTRQVANVSHNMLSFHSVGRKHYNISTVGKKQQPTTTTTHLSSLAPTTTAIHLSTYNHN